MHWNTNSELDISWEYAFVLGEQYPCEELKRKYDNHNQQFTLWMQEKENVSNAFNCIEHLQARLTKVKDKSEGIIRLNPD